jgi:hypothetical protein
MKVCNKCHEPKAESFYRKQKSHGSYILRAVCKACEAQDKLRWRVSPAGKLSQYKGNAKTRNIAWELTRKEFESFWQEPCSYCGSEIETIGLDRIDSSQSYNIDNVVSCCSICNAMKLDHSYEKWINHMKKVIKHQGE